jgi:outer membrane immunogenic protein
MRRLLLAAAMFGTAAAAQAADMPDFLRGSLPASAPATRNWEGWYAGGQASYSSSEIDFGRSVVSLTNFIFRDSTLQAPTSQFSLLSKNHAQGTGFGAFVGRNYQWDDVVLSVEANYNYLTNLASSSQNTLSRAIVNPSGTVPPTNHTYTYNTTLTGDAALQIKDVLTFRGRAGWAAGAFLPYMFGGVAVGRMDVARSVSSDVVLLDDSVKVSVDQFGSTITTPQPTQVIPIPTLSQTMKEERTNSFVVGWTGGLGLEYCLWGNVFMRGEWEYVRFINVKDTAVSMNNVRAGIGYKF